MIGFPFDSHIEYDEFGYPIYDRAISSAPYRELLRKLFNDGVMPNPSTNMQVIAGEGLKVTILSGFAMVRGCMKLAESNESVSLSPADSTYKRIDTIVLRLNTNDSVRSLEYAVITGTPASNPVAPDLVRTASIYDIGLADVLVNSNATSLSDGNITDTRYNSNKCGILSSISEFDTTTLYNQVQADLTEFRTTYEAEMSTWTQEEKDAFETWSTMSKAEFDAWFENVKDILDESVAGKLQNEIDELNTKVDNLKFVHIIVHYDADFIGANITATNGTETYTIKATNSMKVEFNCINLGTWTITGVDQTATITAIYYGNYNVTLQSWNYKAWLTEAGITQTFSNLNAVLADEKTIRILMDKHNSVDYLAECDDASIITQIMTSGYVEKWTNLCDYALDTLYAIDRFKSVMDSTNLYGYGELELVDGNYQPKGCVPVMTGNSAPYGEVIYSGTLSTSEYPWKAFANSSFQTSKLDNNYIGYKFTRPAKIKSIHYKNNNSGYGHSVKVQYSDDNSTWTDCSETYNVNALSELNALTNVNGYHIYYRFLVKSLSSSDKSTAISSLQFYGRELKVSVPTMKSNSEPYGEVTESRHYNNGSTRNDIGWHVFDKSESTNWMATASSDTKTTDYVGYKFNSLVLAKYCRLRLNRAQKFCVEGSNDNSTWTIIGQVNNGSTADTLTNYYLTFEDNTAYQYYRFRFTENINNNISVSNFDIYGHDYTERTSRRYIYDNGLELEEITANTNNASCVAEKRNTELYISVPATAQRVSQFYTTNKISFSGKNSIRAKSGTEIVSTIRLAYATSGVPFGYSNTSGNGYINFGSVDTYLDISSVNTENYIDISVSNNTGTTLQKGTIKELWLE